MKLIRVLQVFALLDRGGAETMIMNLYRKIDRNKIQFDFVANKAESKYAFEEEIKSLGGKVYYVPKYKIINTLSYRKAWQKLLSEHPEWQIIHAHHTTPASIYLQTAKQMGRYTIAHSHNATKGLNIRTIIKKMLEKRLPNHTMWRFACSYPAGNNMFKHHEFTIFPNAINTIEFAFSPTIRREVIEEFSLEGQVTVGHVGRFDTNKNHDYLIDIFYAMHRLNQNTRLLLIGDDGPMADAIKTKTNALGLQDAVIFTGVRTDVARLMQAMDVFIFPSVYEGFGVAVIEAQASGLPCVVSTHVPLEVKVLDNVTFLSLQESPEKWASIALNEARKKRSDGSLAIKKAGYDAETNAKWLEDFYSDQLKTSH